VDFDSLMIAFSRRKVEVRRSRSVENDLRDFEMEFWSRVVAEEGKMRTHTRAEMQPVISLGTWGEAAAYIQKRQ